MRYPIGTPEYYTAAMGCGFPNVFLWLMALTANWQAELAAFIWRASGAWELKCK